MIRQLMLYCFDVVSMFPITSKVLWQHFIFNVFAFIPILNDKKYYIKMYLLGLLLAFPLFNNFRHLYERNFSFNYELFETAHFDAFQTLYFY
jgi:hypothetical protein